MLLQILASEAHHPNSKILPGDLNEVYIGSVAFLIVVGLIVKLAGPAMAKGFSARSKAIEQELADAAAAKEQAEAQLVESSADLPDVDAEAERILAEAKETAARLKQDLIAQATTDAEELRTRGNAEVDNLRRQAVADLSTEISTLARGAAEALIDETLDQAVQSDLIDGYITQLEQSV